MPALFSSLYIPSFSLVSQAEAFFHHFILLVPRRKHVGSSVKLPTAPNQNLLFPKLGSAVSVEE